MAERGEGEFRPSTQISPGVAVGLSSQVLLIETSVDLSEETGELGATGWKFLDAPPTQLGGFCRSMVGDVRPLAFPFFLNESHPPSNFLSPPF